VERTSVAIEWKFGLCGQREKSLAVARKRTPDCPDSSLVVFLCGEVPRSRFYGRTAVLRFIVQPCDEDEEKDDQFFFTFPSNGAPVE
jgi:hypothetical protein